MQGSQQSLPEGVAKHCAELWFGCTITFFIFATLLTGVRVFSRHTEGRKKWGWDDVLISASLLPFWGFVLTGIVVVVRIVPVFLPGTPEDEVIKRSILYSKGDYACSILYDWACGLPRLSMCCLFLRLMEHQRRTKIVVQGVVAYIIAEIFVFTLIDAIPCHPMRLAWRGWSGDPQPRGCINFNARAICSATSHIASDVVMLALPLPMIRKVQLSFKKKIWLAITFLSGSLGLVGCCIRLPFYLKTNTKVYDTGAELATVVIPSDIFTLLEPTMYIIAANLPPLRQPVTRWSREVRVPEKLRHALPWSSRSSGSTSSRRLNMVWPFNKYKRSNDAHVGYLGAKDAEDQACARSSPTRLQVGKFSNLMITRFAEDLREGLAQPHRGESHV